MQDPATGVTTESTTARSSDVPRYVLVERRRGPVPKASCCVYLVAATDELTKVGMSSDPVQRLNSLRTANAEKLTLCHHWRLPSRDQAAALETRLHKLFKWAKARREWFAVEPRYIKSVATLLFAGDEPGAEALAAILCEERKAHAMLSEVMRRYRLLNARWHKEERDELSLKMDIYGDLQHRDYTRALDAGLEPTEWDHVLGRWEPQA